MHSTLALMTVSLALGAPPIASTPPANFPVISQCTISSVEEVQIPAKEAGVLTLLKIKEGAYVEKGNVLGTIDDDLPRAQWESAIAKRDASHVRAENDIHVRYSTKAAEVALAEYTKSVMANQRTPGSISEVEVSRLKLAAEKAKLEIEQSQLEGAIAKCDEKAENKTVEVAKLSYDRRKIITPIDGEVRALRRHVGEWVQPGDVVIHVVRLDRLRVEGFLSATQWDRGDVKNKPVVVDVVLARGKTARFQGQIEFVGNEIEAGGEFRVRAEIQNRRENDEWLLYPGQIASMAIEVDAAVAAPRATSRPGALAPDWKR